MLKLKLQYFGHLMPRADSLEKMLMLGKIEGKRRRGQQRMGWLDNSKGQGSLACCSSWGRKELGRTERLYFHFQFSSVTQSRPTLFYPMDCSTPGFPVHHQLLKLAQTHVH